MTASSSTLRSAPAKTLPTASEEDKRDLVRTINAAVAGGLRVEGFEHHPFVTILIPPVLKEDERECLYVLASRSESDTLELASSLEHIAKVLRREVARARKSARSGR